MKEFWRPVCLCWIIARFLPRVEEILSMWSESFLPWWVPPHPATLLKQSRFTCRDLRNPQWMYLTVHSRSIPQMTVAFWRGTGLGITQVGRLPRPGVEVLKSSGSTTEKEERLSNTASAGCFLGSRPQVCVEQITASVYHCSRQESLGFVIQDSRYRHIEKKGSLLAVMLPRRTINIHGIFPFHKSVFIVERGSLDV